MIGFAWHYTVFNLNIAVNLRTAQESEQRADGRPALPSVSTSGSNPVVSVRSEPVVLRMVVSRYVAFDLLEPILPELLAVDARGYDVREERASVK